MKKLLFVFIFVLLTVLITNGQTKKGNYLFGVSSSLIFEGTGSGPMNIGFSSTKIKSDAIGFQESDPDKSFGINLSPKVAYFITDNVAAGLDFVFGISNAKYNSRDLNPNEHKTMLIGGPFIRYYFLTNRVLPYAEIEATSGMIWNKTTYDSSVFDAKAEGKNKISSFSGGIGIAAMLGDRASLDAMLRYSRYLSKLAEDNPNNQRAYSSNLNLTIGFSIILGKTK